MSRLWLSSLSGLLALPAYAPNPEALPCVNVTRSNFNPDCLPQVLRNFSDIGVQGQEAPYKYLQWILAENCGQPLAQLATEFATLPEVISRGLRGVFMLWSLYILGNFLAVAVMSIFQVAPLQRRCWGFFRQSSYDYKSLVGPLYYVLMALSIVVAAGMTWRFFGEVHAFRSLLLRKMEIGAWPDMGIASADLPPQGCLFVMGLRWMGYRHCFDLLLLMTFTGLDVILLTAEVGWMCVLQFLACCRCFFCSFWKGCCGICGYLCCNTVAGVCCLLPLLGVIGYLLVGLLAAAISGLLSLALFGMVLLSLSWALRRCLATVTCLCCKPLPAASWFDLALLLYPFPPGSPYFTTAKAVRRPLNEQEEQDDMELRQATHTRTTTSFDVVETHLDSSYSIWERHLGVPHPWITYAFPAWWSMVVAPALLLAVAVAAFHHSNALLFSQALAFSDLSWLPTTAMSAWPYHWCIIKAVCAGITDAFHGLFVEAPLRILTAPRQTWNSFWGFADTSSDFLNLFAVDHPHGELVAGQFEGNFRIFRSTVLLLRLILTMLFACLRLTAVIARTPDEREESESDSAWEEVEEEFCGA